MDGRRMLNTGDVIGNSPLMLSLETRSFDIAEQLQRSNADVNHANNNGKTALYCAVEKEDVEVVQFLLRYKASVDVTDINGVHLLTRVSGGTGAMEHIYRLLQDSDNNLESWEVGKK